MSPKKKEEAAAELSVAPTETITREEAIERFPESSPAEPSVAENIPAVMPAMNDVNMQQLDDVFTYHRPNEEQVVRYGALREAARMLAWTILAHCPPSADRTASLRKVREAVMTANASIALNGRAF